jgi:multiple antibiotic resistance protein
MDQFLLAFIPLFVAIDVFGVLPLFVGLTEGMDERRLRTLIAEAIGAAVVVSLLFLVGGKMIFSFLGITENDFRVGGGIVLLVLAVTDLLFARDTRLDPLGSVGIVPIGIPLIMGPAALTTILLLVDSYGYLWTILSLLGNMLIVWVTFLQARRLTAVMGEAGARAVAKVAALLLAGIAVMMVRSGITAMLGAP